MIRLISQPHLTQQIALALGGQGTDMGLWGLGERAQDLSRSSCRRDGKRGQVHSSELGLSRSTCTEWGADLGQTPYPNRFLPAQDNRPDCRSGVYREQPPVSD